jgi:group I intron endonuclease
MGHQPTIFYILENQTLGTWWIGKIESTLDGYGMPPYRSITQDQLNEKLSEKYHNPNAYLTLVTLNKRWSACYGVERWLSKLEYKISKEPEKYQELEELLKAGWDGENETSTLSVLHVLEHGQPVDKIFKKLVSSREGLTRCLNTYTGKTRAEKYQETKKDPDFMYRRARKEVLRQMEKTKKLPKPETLAKYEIKEDEIKECMGPKGIIYKITSPSGKVYVGQTMRSFKKRMQEHKSKHSGCTLLRNAIQKYNDQMKYEIIESNIPQEQLDEREIYWINHFNSLAPHGYNLGTGGHYERGYTQEAKDNMRNATIKSKIEKNGYLGSVEQEGNLFYPRAQNNCNKLYLSNGGFRTEEECIEVLKEYTKDPDNFIKVDSPYKRKDGSVLKRCEKWTVKYKNVYLGDYETEAKGWEAIEMYQRDPEKFVKPERITTGHIFKRCNIWNLRYKGNFLGSYDTQKEAQEALGRYREDPKKFIKGQRKYNGTIFKSGDKWRFRYKHKHIGYYSTREEAEEARQALQSS